MINTMAKFWECLLLLKILCTREEAEKGVVEEIIPARRNAISFAGPTKHRNNNNKSA